MYQLNIPELNNVKTAISENVDTNEYITKEEILIEAEKIIDEKISIMKLEIANINNRLNELTEKHETVKKSNDSLSDLFILLKDDLKKIDISLIDKIKSFLETISTSSPSKKKTSFFSCMSANHK